MSFSWVRWLNCFSKTAKTILLSLERTCRDTERRSSTSVTSDTYSKTKVTFDFGAFSWNGELAYRVIIPYDRVPFHRLYASTGLRLTDVFGKVGSVGLNTRTTSFFAWWNVFSTTYKVIQTVKKVQKSMQQSTFHEREASWAMKRNVLHKKQRYSITTAKK